MARDPTRNLPVTKWTLYQLSHCAGIFCLKSQLQAGVILEGDLGEKVSLSWLTSPYLKSREKWKCIACIGKSKIWTKTSPWNPEYVAKPPSLKALPGKRWYHDRDQTGLILFIQTENCQSIQSFRQQAYLYFLISPQKIRCGYSLELLQQDDSNGNFNICFFGGFLFCFFKSRLRKILTSKWFLERGGIRWKIVLISAQELILWKLIRSTSDEYPPNMICFVQM